MIDLSATTETQRKKTNPLTEFIAAVSGVTLHPARFYGELSGKISLPVAIGFAGVTSALFGILASVFGGQGGEPLAIGLHFLNGFSMPFILAFLLFLVSIPLCRGTFTLRRLLALTAYANVTLLVAWMPGLPYLAGIWKFCLIGLGMVKMGNIGRGRAVVCVLATISLFLILIHLLHPLVT